MSVLFSIVLALSVIALLWIYFTRTQDEGGGCQSDAISWKPIPRVSQPICR